MEWARTCFLWKKLWKQSWIFHHLYLIFPFSSTSNSALIKFIFYKSVLLQEQVGWSLERKGDNLVYVPKDPEYYNLSSMTKSIKWPVRPAKTQISLDVRPVWGWSKSSVSAWRRIGSLATQRAHTKNWSGWSESLCWAYSSFCWFCRAAAHLIPISKKTLNTLNLNCNHWIGFQYLKKVINIINISLIKVFVLS